VYRIALLSIELNTFHDITGASEAVMPFSKLENNNVRNRNRILTKNKNQLKIRKMYQNPLKQSGRYQPSTCIQAYSTINLGRPSILSRRWSWPLSSGFGL